MSATVGSNPFDGQVNPARDACGDWPSFADEPRLPGLGFWLAMLAGGLMSAVGFGLLIMAVL
jgi:hypothetical protein